MQEAASYAFFIIVVIVAGAIGLMIDLSRNATCKQCAHCRVKANDKKRGKEAIEAEARRINHQSWHLSEGTENCPYCAESGEVPPLSGSSKKE